MKGKIMQFIADFWWVWGIALMLSAAVLTSRMIGHVRNPSALLAGNTKGTFLSFVPVWTFSILLFLSIILNIIQFAQGG